MALLGYFELVLTLVCLIFLWSLRNDNTILHNWPLVGMLPPLLLAVKNIHERCTELLRQAGGTFLFKGPLFANMDMLATVDPDNVHYIMSASFSNFPKGPKFREIFEFLGDGIFNSDDELWRNQRKKTRALINHQHFHRFMGITSWDKVEKGLIPVLEYVSEQGLIVDLQDIFQRFTFDSTCLLVTGYDMGCLSVDFPDVPFAKAMDDAEEAVFSRHLLPQSLWRLQKWLAFGEEKKLKNATDIINNDISNFISRKRKELSSEWITPKEDIEGVDLLTSYILSEDDRIELKCRDKSLRDVVLNLILAGRDTTSSSLTWFIWLVLTNPKVEEKIREEIKDNIPANEARNFRLFKVEELRKMVYLHGALCEALRLYPPVPFQQKTPIKPDVLPSGHKVHPNMKIVFPLYAMGRMESIWGNDCLEFKPERWISDSGTIKHEPSYKFFAFNAGPRTCLGKDVAFTQLKAVAAALLHNYHVQMVEGHPVAPNVSIILYMKYGLIVRIAKRWP